MMLQILYSLLYNQQLSSLSLPLRLEVTVSSTDLHLHQTLILSLIYIVIAHGTFYSRTFYSKLRVYSLF